MCCLILLQDTYLMKDGYRARDIMIGSENINDENSKLLGIVTPLNHYSNSIKISFLNK
ncbi:hypothetical protein Gromo_00011 [Candidatus Gromoviella agglomerans]|nr:hypothetical protein Gromo_00011 [Candidatus Gromoviella agglomerans]